VPVVTLQCLAPDEPTRILRVLKTIVTDVADVIGGQPSGTWAHWVPMATVVQGTTEVGYHGHCPIVTVRGQSRDENVIVNTLRAVAAAVSKTLELPIEDVWVQWLDVSPGRAFAGGEVT
jgi:hypothetical protein